MNRAENKMQNRIEQRKEETEFESGLQRLIDLYGDDFPWMPLNGSSSLLKEAVRECAEGHPLCELIAEAVAKCEANDDVLFRLSDGRFAKIHLTWAAQNTAGYPRFELLESARDVLSAIQTEWQVENKK